MLANAIYRLQADYQPDANAMGLFASGALAANVISANVLIPHRMGDANVRAVWLFSRNDAFGNLAVVIAAGPVAWTSTAWPDSVVALVIAGLFLQSSLSIIADARRDLQDGTVLAIGSRSAHGASSLACSPARRSATSMGSSSPGLGSPRS